MSNTYSSYNEMLFEYAGERRPQTTVIPRLERF